MNLMERVFKLREQNTDVRTELLAGLTTFLTMAYIVFVNPSILGDAGMPKDAVFVATCVAAAIGTLVMGLYANYPIAMAPGMGLNAYFAYGVVKGMGFSWEAALGAVCISGILFVIVSTMRIREMIIRGIPHSVRTAITAGIGLFLAIISLKNAGIITSHPATYITLGDLHKAPAILAIVGFFLIVALDRLQVKGAILIGIVAVTILSFFFGGNQFGGVVSMPPSISPTLFKLDISAALSVGILNVVLVFFLVELFDATGTLMGVANRAGLLKEGKM
ncbi:MAG: NCS2 family permease, partial [Bacillota bacterium]